jgi:serine/threonine protein phosphatase PrpC
MEDAHTVELGSGSYAPRSAGGAAATSEEATAASGAKESKPDLGRPSRAGVADELSNALNMPSSPDSLCAFFGVYDGHGGKRASDFASTILHHHILANAHFQTDLKLAIREGFQRTEQEFLDIARKDNMGDGTTALIAFIKRGKLYIGNIGDSEAVLSRNGTAVPLTTVHNPGKNPTEIERVKREGGRLYHDTRLAHPSLNPSFFNLGVSRSIGDLLFKHPDFTKGKPSGLTAEPDIVDIALEKTDQFIILACDGLWDVMDHQQAVDFVREALKQDDDPQVACKALGEEAYKKGSQDNITVVVCTLKEDLDDGAEDEVEQRSDDEVEEVRVVRAELKEDVPW